MNLASCLILLVVLIAIGLAVRQVVHNQRHPEDSSDCCHSSCGCCSLRGACHKNTPPPTSKRI